MPEEKKEKKWPTTRSYTTFEDEVRPSYSLDYIAKSNALKSHQSPVEPSRMEKDEYMVCPAGHHILFTRDNYDKVICDGDFDHNGMPMCEEGLYCLGCNKPYGLSKLEKPEEPKK